MKIAIKPDTSCSVGTGNCVLALQWAKGLGPRNQFTIHGLWPNQRDGTPLIWNAFGTSRYYSSVEAALRVAGPSLVSQMHTYWPSNKKSNDDFWAHEWNKHGTCMPVHDRVCHTVHTTGDDIASYVKTTLLLHRHFDYYNALAKHGIVPSNAKTVDSYRIKAAIKAELGVDVVLKCRQNVLAEIWAYFVFDAEGTFVPTAARIKDSCTGHIIYPTK